MQTFRWYLTKWDRDGLGDDRALCHVCHNLEWLRHGQPPSNAFSRTSSILFANITYSSIPIYIIVIFIEKQNPNVFYCFGGWPQTNPQNHQANNLENEGKTRAWAGRRLMIEVLNLTSRLESTAAGTSTKSFEFLCGRITLFIPYRCAASICIYINPVVINTHF